MSRVNELFNKKAEEFLRTSGLGKLEITYKYYYVEDYKTAKHTFYKKGSDITMNLGYNGKGAINEILNNTLFEGCEFIPLWKYEDSYDKCAEFRVFDKETLEELSKKFKILKEDYIYGLWNEVVNSMSYESFNVELKELTLEEFDRLEANREKIHAYMKKIAHGE